MYSVKGVIELLVNSSFDSLERESDGQSLMIMLHPVVLYSLRRGIGPTYCRRLVRGKQKEGSLARFEREGRREGRRS